uniref:Uncharacterized protein n=1 Tax=viral metagenome TaxID=1070528 RepID=A0A6M3LGQ3_9ZZZZ
MSEFYLNEPEYGIWDRLKAVFDFEDNENCGALMGGHKEERHILDRIMDVFLGKPKE